MWGGADDGLCPPAGGQAGEGEEGAGGGGGCSGCSHPRIRKGGPPAVRGGDGCLIPIPFASCGVLTSLRRFEPADQRYFCRAPH